MKEAGKKLAEEHWGYVEKLLSEHHQEDGLVEMIGFHYMSAMEHGFKHGVEYVAKPAYIDSTYINSNINPKNIAGCSKIER